VSIHENRLTHSDYSAIIERVCDVVHRWQAQGGFAIGVDDEALRRVAYHSIGCSVYDLRDSELDVIGSLVLRLTSEVYRRRREPWGWWSRPGVAAELVAEVLP
jgi:hypothetical protein